MIVLPRNPCRHSRAALGVCLKTVVSVGSLKHPDSSKTSRQLAPVDQSPHIPAQSSRRRLDPVLCGCDPTARLDPTCLARLADTPLLFHSDPRREKTTTPQGALPRGPCSPVGIRCL